MARFLSEDIGDMEDTYKTQPESIEWKETEEFEVKLQLVEQGNADAMYDIGVICDINHSSSEAAQWFLRAAKRGNAMAYYSLGKLFEDGKVKNIKNREDKIVKYYGISAVLGCSYGQKKLADCYYEGKFGLSQDVSLAKDWYEYSAKQDNPDAAFMLGNITKDAVWFKKAAELGSVEAQYKIAIYCNDSSEKEKWLVLASDSGYLPAILLLAETYEQRDTSESNKAAYKLYGVAVAKHNNSDAAVKMADMLTTGVPGIDRNVKYAKELIDFAAQYNHPEALYKLGCMYWTGNELLDIQKDASKAVEYLRNAASRNHVGAAYNYGVICANGGDGNEAKKYLVFAASNGHDDAKYEAAKICWEKGSFDEGIRWYTESAKVPNVNAQKSLGEIYRLGKNTTKDYKKAVQIYSMNPACEDDAVQLLIGQMYQSGGFGLNKDEEVAYAWIRKSAERGNIEAVYYVGVALRMGKGTVPNLGEALSWLEKAAQKDYVEAIILVGLMYANGEGTPNDEPDYIKALQYEKRGTELGSSKAKYYLALLYYDGNGVERDFSLAFSLLLEAAQDNILEAMKKVAEMYEKGEGTEESIENALYWYKNAAEKNDSDSAYVVAEMYRLGKLVGHDDGEALKYYEISAKQRNISACDIAGYMYLYGEGCKPDTDKALTYLNIAAEAGVMRAQACLGEIYYGYENFSQAIVWYRKAAEQGEVKCAYGLAELYRLGKGTAVNNIEALSWYEKAAKGNEINAFEWAGYLNETGEGINNHIPDYSKAIAFYNQAISQKSFFAMERVGILYFDGVNVAPDYSEAFKLISSAATEGNRIISQRYLALMYRDGKGTVRDLKLAYSWFKKAADANDVQSMHEVAEMLRNGAGIDQDIEQAFVYYDKAAQMKHPESCDWAAFMLVQGTACKQDFGKAKCYFAIAAAAGIARAQYYTSQILMNDKAYQAAVDMLVASANAGYLDALCKLGEEYSTGRIIPRDISKAEPYLRSAISQGSLRACALLGYNLWFDSSASNYQEAVGLFDHVLTNDTEGKAYDKATLLYFLAEANRLGKGVSQDLMKSFGYYSSSSALGNSNAMVQLAIMYKEGRIVPKDRKKARTWMDNAARLGNEYAKKKTNSLLYNILW